MGMTRKRCPRCTKLRPQRHDLGWRRLHAERDEFLEVTGPSSEPYRLVCMWCVDQILRATLSAEEIAEMDAHLRPNGSFRRDPSVPKRALTFEQRLAKAVTSSAAKLHITARDEGGGSSGPLGSYTEIEVYGKGGVGAEKFAALLRACNLDAETAGARTVRVYERRGTGT